MTREQFIALVKSEQEALRGFLLALCCGKRDDADDIAQETLARLTSLRRPIETRASFARGCSR